VKPVFDTLLVDGARIPKSIINLLIVLALCCASLAALILLIGEPEPPIKKVELPSAPPMPGLSQSTPFEREFRGLSLSVTDPTPQGVRIKFENRYRLSVQHWALFHLYVLTDNTWVQVDFTDKPDPSSRSGLFKYSRLNFTKFYGEPLQSGSYRIVFRIWLRDGLLEGDKEKIKNGWSVERIIYLYTDFVIP